jgi:hypothetical protein
MNEAQVVQIVREQLRKHRIAGLTLDVVEGELWQRDGYWWVPVRPSAQPPRMYALYDVLAEIEEMLEESAQLNVQFVPLLPEEASPANSKDVAPNAKPKHQPTRRLRLED